MIKIDVFKILGTKMNILKRYDFEVQELKWTETILSIFKPFVFYFFIAMFLLNRKNKIKYSCLYVGICLMLDSILLNVQF